MTEAGKPSGGSEPDELSKGERTRRRLLELAIDHFGRKGFRSTSVSEIAREAGLTQAASYAYFDSKLDLFRQAVDQDVQGLLTGVVDQVADTPVRQLLPVTLVLLVSSLADHPLAERVLAGQEAEGTAQLRELPTLVQVRSQLADRLRAGQAAGEVRADIDPTTVATGLQVVLLGLLISLVTTTAPGEPATPPPPEVTAGVLAVFDAVLAPPGGIGPAAGS